MGSEYGSGQDEDFRGDELVLLPECFLNSSDAAYELHRERIDARIGDLQIGGLTRRVSDAVLSVVRRAVALWLVLGCLTVCV